MKHFIGAVPTSMLMFSLIFSADVFAQSLVSNKPPLEPLRYALSPRPAYSGGVQSISDNLAECVSPQALFSATNASDALAEGLYLAMLYPDRNAQHLDAIVCRVRVKEIRAQGSVILEFAKEAISHVERGLGVSLYRPVGTTTAMMESAPDFARFRRGTFDDIQRQSFLNAKTIALAFQNFHDIFHSFPPAVVYGPDGKPWHSWRVLILAFLSEDGLLDEYRFTEPWDGPSNSKLIARMPSVYSDPIHGENPGHFTHYAVLSGDDTAFPESGYHFDGKNNDIFRKWKRQKETSLEDITDGLANTLVLGSVGPEMKIPWTKPQDIVVFSKLPRLGAKGGFATPHMINDHPVGAFAFADGSVRFIRKGFSQASFLKMATIAGGEELAEDEMPDRKLPRLTPILEFRSGRDGMLAHLLTEAAVDATSEDE